VAKSNRSTKGLPWHRAGRGWYVTLNGVKTPIKDKYGVHIKDKDRCEQARAAWLEMLALAKAHKAGDDSPVWVILEKFMNDLAERASQATVAEYKRFFTDFCKKHRELLVRDLTPDHVKTWWAAHPTWNASTRSATGAALKAAFRWAALPGRGKLISRSPLEGMPLPTKRKRAATVVLSEEEFGRVLDGINSQPVRDLLTVLWLTGARPSALARARAEHLTPDGGALVFEKTTEEDRGGRASKTGRTSVIVLPGAARDICLRLRQQHPEGALFRTARGAPWTKKTIASAVAFYAEKAGLSGRFTAYSCRHSKATHMLEAGVSDVDVAALLGHHPATLHKHYSYVAARWERLKGLADRMASPLKSAGSGETHRQGSEGGADAAKELPAPAD
jgi:integrase